MLEPEEYVSLAGDSMDDHPNQQLALIAEFEQLWKASNPVKYPWGSDEEVKRARSALWTLTRRRLPILIHLAYRGV